MTEQEKELFIKNGLDMLVLLVKDIEKKCIEAQEGLNPKNIEGDHLINRNWIIGGIYDVDEDLKNCLAIYKSILIANQN